jgi:urease subunit alpha
MILMVHGGSPDVDEDVRAAAERIHPATMAAEGPLHDLGAISIINSDSQGMGRIGETIRRTWQLAHCMKAWASGGAGERLAREAAPERPPRARSGIGHAGSGDNERVLRYLAKYTAEPARTHGIDREVGSLAPGRLADIVLWRPSHFGVRPEIVFKGGEFAWGALGSGNASVEGAEPRRYSRHWGAMGNAAAPISTTFVSRAALEERIADRIGTRRRFVAVEGTRGVRRASLVANRTVPRIEVDATDGTVSLNGDVLACDPVDEVPLSRRYLLA